MKITKRPELGARAFEVNYCTELPCVEGSNDADMDAAKYRREYFTTKAEAIKRAKELLPVPLGAVLVTECEWTDPIGENLSSTFQWEEVGDAMEVA